MKEQLSFIGLASTAIRIVTGDYPSASFRGAIGGVPGGGTTADAEAVTEWDFNFGDGTTAATINLRTQGEWGNFGTPVYTPTGTGGNVIPWPIEMDVPEAVKLLQGAGYTQPFNGLTLHWPVHAPPYTQPLYIFSFPGAPAIAVGTYDKSVFVL